jgi:hypothetical protein
MEEQPAYHLTYYQKNRDKMIDNAKRYREAHPDIVRANQQRYFQTVLKPRRAFERKLRLIEEGKWPPKPKETKTRTRRFVGEVKKTTKKIKQFPDISQIADIPVTPPSSGLVEQKPGVFLDWNNL